MRMKIYSVLPLVTMILASRIETDVEEPSLLGDSICGKEIEKFGRG